MSRSVGGVVSIQELLPDWVAVLLGLLTQFGDAWFLVLLLAFCYWTQVDKQDDVLLVAGMYVAGLGLYRYLKFVFELPRPDAPLLDPELVPWVIRPLYEATAFASSYGFPSGHATATTIVYFGLATVLTVGTRRLRYIGAAAIVGTVSFTRVALGVHFLVDIVVGIALGGLLLLVTFRGLEYVSRDRVSVLLFGGILTTSLYVFESSAHLEAVLALGLALGMFGGWQLVVLARTLVEIERPSHVVRPVVLRGSLAAAAIGPLALALELFPVLSGEPYPLGGLAGLGAVVAVIVPIARYSESVLAVWAAVSFWLTATLREVQTVCARGYQRLRK